MHVNQMEFTNVMQQRHDQYSNNNTTTDYNQQVTLLNNNNTAYNMVNDDIEVNNNNYENYDHTKEEETNSAADEAALKNLTVEEVKNLLRLQLEFYFSRENLMHDKYLSSQMDGDNYVPIATISTFNMIKKYNPTMELICEAVEESPSLQLDSTRSKIRAACKRCVIILRDITSTLEEIVKLFDDERCPKCVNCEFAGNKSWYVTFKHEDDAKQAFQYLKEHVQTYQGKPIFARIKAHPIPRSSTSSGLIGNKIQSDKIVVNSTVLQQSTTPIPAQVYTPNSIDSSHQVIPVQNQAALNAVPLAHAQAQYHPRIYSQPAAMYSLGQGNIQYLQQSFYPPWISQNVIPNPNMQPIDQLTYQNNRSYHNMNLNSATVNQNSSSVNSGTNNQQAISPNSANNANPVAANQNQGLNRNGRPIHNKSHWSYRNNRNNVPNNKHISPRYNNNHYSNQSIQQQNNDSYATTTTAPATTATTTTTTANTATSNDVKSNSNNNYEYKQQQQQQQLNEYQLYHTNSYNNNNNEIRRFSNNNNSQRQRNVNRHQNYYNSNNSNNNANNTTETTNSLPTKHYSSNHRSNRYHQSNNLVNGKDSNNGYNNNGYYNNTTNTNNGSNNNNNVNERINANQNIDNSNSRSTTTTSNNSNGESNGTNPNKTIFDYQPNSFPPLNNNINNNFNEKYIIDDNNNNKNTSINKDNDSNALFVNNDDDNNETDNKTSIDMKSTAATTSVNNIPIQHEAKNVSNDNTDSKKALASPSVRQQQQHETIDNKMNGLSISNTKKGSPNKVDDNNNSRKFTFAQIVQQNAEQNKLVDENSTDTNCLTSPSTSLIQSTNTSGDEQESRNENKNKLTNGKKMRQPTNNSDRKVHDLKQRNDDENNRNRPKKYRNSSATTTNAAPNNKSNTNNTTKRQNDTNNKFKSNISNTAVVA